MIEDEKKVASYIKRGLGEEDYIVDIAHEGERGILLAEVNTYDLIILDLMLPDKDGLSICRELRDKKITVPILMLSAKDATKDKVRGLDVGADDYLSKPFAFEELLARIRSLMRRERPDTATTLKAGDLELNLLTHEARRAAKTITLTSKEFALLEYLMLNVNHVVTRTMISEHVWNEGFDSFTNVIDVYINYLRDKVDEGFQKKLIHTVRGKGYILKE